MSREMCETAKKLTEAERKKIYDFIDSNSTGNIENWTQGWYEHCMSKDSAVEEILEAIERHKAEPLQHPSPAYIQDLITYSDD